MLFNSYIFIFAFLPLCLLGCFWLLGKGSRPGLKNWLTLCSLVFYGWAGKEWLILLIGSASFNFLIAKLIAQHRQTAISRARLILALSIAANIGLLFYFKYRSEVVLSLNHLLSSGFTVPAVVLPLAISFFSFHQVAYLVDVYNKKIDAETDPANYILFISFFPHLIAGPIIYYREFRPQLLETNNYSPQWENIKFGALLFAIGLAKKTCIADPIGTWVDNGFANALELNRGESIAITYLFGLQLYFDFSAYCDMALGLARIFNIHFPLNFNSPYKSKNLQEFWTRWHITLGRFFRDYLYIPLGGNRVGFARQQFNLLVVLVLSGLWHGSNWLFFLWGLWHGVGMVFLQIWRRLSSSLSLSIPPWVGLLLTVNFWVLSLVFFRSHSWQQAIHTYKQIFQDGFFIGGLNQWLLNKSHFITDSSAFYWLMIPREFKELSSTLIIGGALIAGYLICLFLPNAYQLTERYAKAGTYWLVLGVMLTLGLFMITEHTPFIYFQF